jgi:hypothetical protein
MTKILMLPAAGILFGLSACNPYDPGERALSGGLIGAPSGIGISVGGGTGSAVGAPTPPLPPAQLAPYSR